MPVLIIQHHITKLVVEADGNVAILGAAAANRQWLGGRTAAR